MREIKFRAWEKKMKEIIPVHQIDFEKKMINTESAWRLFDEIELMQYTGLKDKNGVEIYEGDILKESSTHPLVVFIKEGHTQISFKDFGIPCEEFIYRNDIEDMDIAVVGNIYENPELLAGEDD
ncbi:YopX family protein [Sporosarcina sp. A2]|uniref:YopX family protein n=1 Tax=Sporosarcina sp. A2 TaxID=3393449 RepID=UPI003D7B37CF